MEITKYTNENELTIAIDGRIDTTTAPQLETEVKNSITEKVSKLIFDFTKVEYMSSAGIRVIMASEKVMSQQGEMALSNVNEEIMEIFEMTGLSDLLQFE